MKSNSDRLVAALSSDKLLNIEEYKLSVDKGMITINGIKQPESINEKYKSITNQFGSSVVELNVSKN